MATVVCSSEENEFVNLAVLDFVCAKFSLEKAKTSVVTGGSGALERLGKASKVDAAVVLATSATEGLQRALGALHGSMTGTGAAHVLLLRDEAWKGDAEAEDAAVRKAVLLAGFTLAEGQPNVSPVPRSLGAIRAATPGKALKELCSYSLAKPQWQQGAKQGLRSKLRRKKKDPAPAPVAKEEVLKAWKLGGGDDDLIDEDVLVEDIQVSPKTAGPTPSPRPTTWTARLTLVSPLPGARVRLRRCRRRSRPRRTRAGASPSGRRARTAAAAGGRWRKLRRGLQRRVLPLRTSPTLT